MNILSTGNKRLLTVLMMCLAFCTFSSSAFAAGFKPETLHYVISYKWGLIHKDAGEATLSLKNNGGVYDIRLTARTKPWADKIFMVRDTLKAKVAASGLKPKSYEKISHEGGKYGKDVIKYSYSGSKVTGHCSRYRDKRGKVSFSEKTLTGSGDVFDMLSVFYYLRSLDYAHLSKGKTVHATIFSGSKTETLTIRNLGVETVELRNKKKASAYHIKFKFTSGGKKKSSDDMDTWISTSPAHIPLLLVGKLPIGQVKCYYIS